MIITNTGASSLAIPVNKGRSYVASAMGTFNGATVTMELKVDGVWRAVPDGAWTAAFRVVCVNDSATEARLTVSGAGGATSLSVNLAEKIDA